MPHAQFKTEEIYTLFNHLDEFSIWIASGGGTFEFVSDGFEEICGIPADDILEHPERLIEISHPDDRDFIRSQLELPEKEVTEVEYESRIVRPDGELRWLKTQHVPIRDSDGTLRHVVGISADITEQKRREQKLNVLNRLIRHDVRNDMAVILGWMELLEDHVDEEGNESLRKALSAGHHIIELTDQAREYVDLIVEDDTLPAQPVPLAPILQSEVDIRREMFPEAEFVVRGELPDVRVLATDMLSSVFRNLLNNAVQHNDKPTPEVTVSVDVNETDVTVSVADNGPGIPDEQKNSIFGEHTTGIESPGTGMGLYLVRRVVTDLGGDVGVADAEPEGAVFDIRLPRPS